MNTLNQKLAAFLLAVILFAASCGWGDSERRKFNQLGVYFNGSNKARVFTVSYAANATETEIKAYGSGRTHTLGAVTVTYFYPADTPNIPDNAVTMADSAMRAMEINGEDGRFTFQGLINSRGKYIFTRVEN